MIYKVFALLPTIVVSDGFVGITWLGKIFSLGYGKNKKKSKNVSLMIGYNTGMSLKSKIDDNTADDYLRRIAEENRI
jgi:hypothetical protein